MLCLTLPIDLNLFAPIQKFLDKSFSGLLPREIEKPSGKPAPFFGLKKIKNMD